MELRHLRYFVAVAEELNFTRAAKRLGISQPPLSLQIRQLEKELGTQLLRRRTRGIELTESGRLMLEEARIILEQVDMATKGVRRRGRGETGRMIIGSAGATYFHPVIPAIIREYGLKFPDIVLVPHASNTALLGARLGAGTVDVAFVWGPHQQFEDVAIVPLVEEDTVIVLPSGHALGNAASAPLTALAEERLVLFPRGLNPTGYDAIIAACKQAGFRPKLGQESPQIVSIMPLVAAGLGVSVVPRSASRIVVEGVSYLSIDGEAPRAQICLMHRRHESSPAIQNFVAVARRLAQKATERASSPKPRRSAG
jgi:DNA-binding transcriptional LysR family regulator